MSKKILLKNQLYQHDIYHRGLVHKKNTKDKL
jgi:hypothetical protein